MTTWCCSMSHCHCSWPLGWHATTEQTAAACTRHGGLRRGQVLTDQHAQDTMWLPPSGAEGGVGRQGISGGLLCLLIRTTVQKGRVLDLAVAQGPASLWCQYLA